MELFNHAGRLPADVNLTNKLNILLYLGLSWYEDLDGTTSSSRYVVNSTRLELRKTSHPGAIREIALACNECFQVRYRACGSREPST